MTDTDVCEYEPCRRILDANESKCHIINIRFNTELEPIFINSFGNSFIYKSKQNIANYISVYFYFIPANTCQEINILIQIFSQIIQSCRIIRLDLGTYHHTMWQYGLWHQVTLHLPSLFGRRPET